MRSRKVVAGAGFLFLWFFVTYYFLQRNVQRLTTTNPPQLHNLETDVYNVHQSSMKLMKRLYNVLADQYPHLSGPISSSSPLVRGLASWTLESSTKASSLLSLLREKTNTILSLQKPPAQDEGAGDGNVSYSAPLSSVTEPDLKLVAGEVEMANGEPVIPILVLACNRISIRDCLNNLLQYRPNRRQFPIIVSQDCGDERTRKVILRYRKQVLLIEQPDQSDISVVPMEKKFKGYYKIARHYGWALNYTFHLGYEYVVIVEDDLNVAPDFFEYFLGTYKLLEQDPTLWCISAWNDNGKTNLIDVEKPELLYRTDFFPGLGWMMSRRLWSELSIKWPKSFWDDWIRQPSQRKDRVCVRPEISRTRTFGKIGVSNGLFFDKHLRFIKLSDKFVPFTKLNLSYLIKDNYDNTFLKEVYQYPVITFEELKAGLKTEQATVRIPYTNREQYKRITKFMGLMDDFKSGVPRTAYNGVVSSYYKQHRIYLTPNLPWKEYNPFWS